jgi:hypothetical protein
LLFWRFPYGLAGPLVLSKTVFKFYDFQALV